MLNCLWMLVLFLSGCDLIEELTVISAFIEEFPPRQDVKINTFRLCKTTCSKLQIR